MNHDRLRPLLTSAERFGVLKGDFLVAAWQAKKIGDDAAHGRQVTEVNATDALRSVRIVLETLYDGEPEPKGMWVSESEKKGE